MFLTLVIGPPLVYNFMGFQVLFFETVISQSENVIQDKRALIIPLF